MVTHYTGSKGPVEIAGMNPHHLMSAHAKLVRDRTDDSRDTEIQAMADRIAINTAEFEAEQAATGGGQL